MTDRYEQAFVDAFARVATQPRPDTVARPPGGLARVPRRRMPRWPGVALAAAVVTVALIVVPGVWNASRPVEATPAVTPTPSVVPTASPSATSSETPTTTPTAEPVRRAVTVIAGQSLREQLDGLSAATGIPVAEFETAAAGWRDLAVPEWAENGLEGFLYPDSYEVREGQTATEILARAVSRFDAISGDLGFAQAAEGVGMTPYEALIVASLVEAEGRRPEDLPKIARVIHNRLAAGMALQLDSSVAYAVGKPGGAPTSSDDRSTDSPYNTYRHKGLPPGPIGSPGRVALDAAVRPAAGDWVYFTTVNSDTGETEFSATAQEHQESVARWRDWCERSAVNREKCGVG